MGPGSRTAGTRWAIGGRSHLPPPSATSLIAAPSTSVSKRQHQQRVHVERRSRAAEHSSCIVAGPRPAPTDYAAWGLQLSSPQPSPPRPALLPPACQVAPARRTSPFLLLHLHPHPPPRRSFHAERQCLSTPHRRPRAFVPLANLSGTPSDYRNPPHPHRSPQTRADPPRNVMVPSWSAERRVPLRIVRAVHGLQ